MIVEEIKKANIEAMKNRDAVSRSIFSVVLNKIKLEEIKKRENGQELVDADVVNILQKAIKELNEEKAFIDTSLNIVSRLCLSAYQYTINSINDYLKYVTISYTYSPKDITYDQVYADFYNRIKFYKEEEQ